MEKIVIIGTGQGGFQAAASLRQDGCTASITMIGDEPGLPYQRPPLSKAYMKEGDADRLLLRPGSFYEQHEIAIIEGRRALEIGRDAKRVLIEGGESLAYDHLILATGASNARPPIRNLDAEGIFNLRTLKDAAALRAAMGSARHALVIGAGFIGLEFAAVASAAGMQVTVVEAAPRVMARVVSPEMSLRFAAMHADLGVRLVTGNPVVEIRTDDAGRASGALLADGTGIEADLVLLAAGVRPNTELAEQAGLEVENGIAVDAFLRTSDPAISALGDCVSFPDPVSGVRIRLESVQAASDHARAVSKRLTGAPSPYAAVPWFWSDQGAWKLQIAGLPGANDEVVVREWDNGGVSVLRFGDGLLHCVETVNAAGEHMACRRLLGAGRRLRLDEVMEYDGRLASLLKRQGALASV